MISVLILTFNEEANLPACLESLSWCDDITVLDSGSTDRTVEIAKLAGAKVVHRTFDNELNHRRYSLKELSFKYQWLYNPDADEITTPELRDEMLAVVKDKTRKEVAYRVRFKVIFRGRWIRFSSLYPTWVMRLFRPDKISLNRLTNLRYMANGEEGRLNNHFLHNTFHNGMDAWHAKHELYARAEAKESLSLYKHDIDWTGLVSFTDPVRRRRALKELSFKMPFRPVLRFLYMYVFRLGVLDGYAGLKYCKLVSWYESRIVAYTKELRRDLTHSSKQPRVLLINQFYVPDTAPTGQLLADVADALAHDGCQVDVICSRGLYGGGRVKAENQKHEPRVCVHRLWATSFGRSHFVGRFIDYLSFGVVVFLRVMTIRKADVAIVLTTPPLVGLLGVALRKLKHTRFTLWTMDVYPEIAQALGVMNSQSFVYKTSALISRCIYRNADRIISLGDIMTKRLVEAGADEAKIVTVHNWTPGDVVSCKPVEAENLFRNKWNLQKTVTFMYSGNLGMGHGLNNLLRAVADVENKENIRLVFVGYGKERKSLELLANDLKLECVDFFPPVDLEQLSESLAVGNIHIVAQKAGTEGLIVPSKIYGILAAGRPVIFIGPNDCEVSQIITQSHAGYVLDPDDTQGISTAITKLASDEHLASDMGRKAREYYDQRFGRDASVSKIIEAALPVNLNGRIR